MSNTVLYINPYFSLKGCEEYTSILVAKGTHITHEQKSAPYNATRILLVGGWN
jgi:hypothetical protein